MLFAAAAVISELDGMREGAMVFVLPLMIYPLALAISGVIRLLRFQVT